MASSEDTTNALEFYRKALNYNVIGRYDPKIKQLLFHTPHASIYKWDFTKDEWNKLDYQGVLAIYLRDIGEGSTILPNESEESNLQDTLTSTNNSSVNLNQKNNSKKNKGFSYTPHHYSTGAILEGKDIYNYGLIVLNRINPDNFSMGIVPNSVINKRKLFDPTENEKNPLELMGVEVKDDLVIIKNLKHEVYGIWIHTIADRQNIYELIKYLLENEPKESFA
ncbi:mRNA-decapping enzyme subunit 1 [Monosporozyma unispora]|nr:mRNA-decapping enzyme subunit 1 [Kazachstania unispora]